MKKLIYSLLPLIFLLGCQVTREKGMNMFVRDREFDIGRHVQEIPVPDPIKVIQIDSEKSEYIYEFKNTGCQWSYLVENKTKKIVSWKFISDPNLCYTTINWGGPW